MCAYPSINLLLQLTKDNLLIMKQKAQQPLSLKLIRLSLVLALSISFVLSTTQVAIDHVSLKDEHALVINKILDVSERTAIRALITEDRQLASELTMGLLEYPFIINAKIYNQQGDQLGIKQRTPPASATRAVTRVLGTEFREYLVPLYSNVPSEDSPGMLLITVDQDMLYKNFYQRTVNLFIAAFIGALILAFILLNAFSRLLTKPLIKISTEIRDIDPRAPEKQRLKIGERNRDDELGQLVFSCNAFIQTVEDLIAERKSTELALLRSEDLLLQTSRLAKVGGWDYDIDNNELRWSEQLSLILGLSPEAEIDLNDIHSRIDQEHKPLVENAISKSIRTGQPFDINFGMVRNDGRNIWVRAVGVGAAHSGKSIWASGILQDITENRLSEQALKLRDFALNQTPDAILTIDSQGRIVVANDTTCSHYGFLRGELIGQTIDIINPEFDMKNWDRWWQRVMDNQNAVTQTYNTSKEGKKFPVEISTGHFIYGDEEFCVMSIKDITERKQQYDEIQHLAYHDTLTGLPNRSLLQDRLGLAITTANRHDYVGAVLFIDLDNFKKINDSLGHPAGDKVLQELAKRFSSHLRQEDTVARLGGDEFVVILPYLSDRAEEAANKAEDLARKLLGIVSRPFYVSDHELQVTASIGLVLFPDTHNCADAVLQFADTAMYQAKANGRDTITRFNAEMAENASRQLNLENQLRNALNNNEYLLYVQPQYSQENRLVGAEILLRWNSPTLGIVSPAEFIPILESTGMIFQVGEWVMRSTCQQIKRWLDAGLWREDLAMGVNISPRQFRQSQFVDQVSSILEETGIPHHHLDIEITEGMVIHNIDEIVTKLKHIRELGVLVSIDDFGTGYSSLNYLKRLPIDTLKIDQSFVQEIPQDMDDAAIVTTIIAMAKQLNLQVIAEGVEKKEQVDFLRDNGCSLYQGYYFNKPMPLDKFQDLLVEEPQKISALNK